jgi:DNA replicative helicase MCM subunit Mcm2 (Cdc46/Mcm family)
MIIHLDDVKYWNYKGPIKCEKCGTEMDVEIKDGKVARI